MTTPKPKARKAACVWLVERSLYWPVTMWFPVFGGVYATRNEAREGMCEQRALYNRAKLRIRKYQRIDK